MTMGYGMGGGATCPQCGYPGTQVGTPAGTTAGTGQPFTAPPFGGMYPTMGGYGMPFMTPPFYGYPGYPGFGPTVGPMMGWGAGTVPGYGGMTYPGFGPTVGPPVGWGAGTMPGYAGMAYPGYTPPMLGARGVGMMSDEQLRDMIYDAIDADPAVPYDTDLNVEVTGGVVTLTGTVPSKRIKHAIGDDVWWIPGVWDINNSLQVAPRRGRAAEETTGARRAVRAEGMAGTGPTTTRTEATTTTRAR